MSLNSRLRPLLCIRNGTKYCSAATPHYKQLAYMTV